LCVLFLTRSDLRIKLSFYDIDSLICVKRKTGQFTDIFIV